MPGLFDTEIIVWYGSLPRGVGGLDFDFDFHNLKYIYQYMQLDFTMKVTYGDFDIDIGGNDGQAI